MNTMTEDILGFTWNSSILPPVMPGDTRRALSIYKQQLSSFVWDAAKLENNPFT